MSAFDYLPHRLLINQSLRKSADQLCVAVDTCQKEYERRAAAYEAEIKEAESQFEARREEVRASLKSQLHAFEEELAGLLDDVSSYSDCSLRLKCLCEQAKLHSAIVNIYKEDERYLSDQMSLIGKEVKLLRARKDELGSLVDVNDIIELSRLSTDDLNTAPSEGCYGLLQLINIRLGALSAGERDAERFALVRLRNIIQERAEYMPLIQYIEWVIQQKIRFSKELKRTRDTIKDQLGEARRDRARVKAEINEAAKELDERARRVRMHWAAPIAWLNAEIYYYSGQKDDAWDEMKSTEREIKHMKDVHSSDQRKWEDLNEYREQCYYKYEQLKGQISEIKALMRRTVGLRRSVSNICSGNGVPLKGDGYKGQKDELSYIESRLAEIDQVRANGYAAAVAECDAKKQLLAYERDARLGELARRLDEADARLRGLISEEAQRKRELREAGEALKGRKAECTLFLLFKRSVREELLTARKDEERAYMRWSDVAKKRGPAEAARDALQVAIEEERRSFDQKLAACHPCPTRPNTEELLEERMLEMYSQKLEAGQ